MFRTVLCLLTLSTASCAVEYDKTRALVERQIADWEVALGSGDTSNMLETFAKDAKICFNGRCGIELEALESVLRKYDSSKIQLMPGGIYSKTYSSHTRNNTLSLNGCTTVIVGKVSMYIENGKITEQHCFCEPSISELLSCAGILPSEDEL
eukprot:TRINITY_DN22330_c0_g1_i1.p1 TRINITY_DN22330_c0_g1~~TRINITY_DN22330_c0_g1_i1.p1  ORF type:complete len:152 (+),score=15.14 TRINITY_DN22330_c0_g1_i1:46-501(+)